MRIAHNLIIDYFRKNNRMPKFKNNGDFDIFSVLSDGSSNAEHKIVQQITDHVRLLLENYLKIKKMLSKCECIRI